MLDHPRPFSEPLGTPKLPKTSPRWPKISPKWHFMTPNGPKTLPMGILHDIVSCWITLGPFQRPTGATLASGLPGYLAAVAGSTAEALLSPGFMFSTSSSSYSPSSSSSWCAEGIASDLLRKGSKTPVTDGFWPN